MTKIPARHQNRGFRTRSGTPAPEHTLAALTADDDNQPRTRLGQLRRFRRIGVAEHPWNAIEEGLLAAAGVSLLASAVVSSPLIAVATLPAALLVPGHLTLRFAGRGFGTDGDPWLPWVLRVVLSLAVWTIAGAVVVVIPGLDPRWLGYAVGAEVLLLSAARLSSLRRHARPRHESTGDLSASAPPGQRWVRSRVLPSQAGVLAIFAGVAAVAIFGAYLISSSGSATQQSFVSISFTEPTIQAYDVNGVNATVEVRNRSTGEFQAELQAFIDGRRVLGRPLVVPEDGSILIPLRGVRTTACWAQLRVQLVGGPQDLRPPPLYASGPRTIPGQCARLATPS
jgi:hypothetical protein